MPDTAVASFFADAGTSGYNINSEPNSKASDVFLQESVAEEPPLEPLTSNVNSQDLLRKSVKPLFVELCCGSARMSESAKFSGFDVLPVDWLGNDHNSRIPFVTMELSDDSQCAILRELIMAGSVKVIWAGVPCGTASRAREIPLSSGRHGPPPLRSSEFPRGLPGLSPDNQARVTKANKIYDNVISLILLHIRYDGLFCY